MVGPAVLDLSSAAAHRANLRDQQAAALDAFYAVTALVGLGLIYLTYSWPDAWLAGLIGIGFILLVYPARRLLAGHYLARAWGLAGLWLAGVLLAAGHWPGLAVSSLVIFPVALLALLVSPRAGLLAAAGLSLAAIALALTGRDPAAAGWRLGIALAWGVTLLIWLALRPLEAALRWSWTRYDASQGALDAARDAQADLKQAVKDLAEANLQTARLNQLLGTARRAAEEAERAKAEFVANVSHELRTPLNMVIGFAELIMSAPKTYGRISTALRADLAVIHRNSQHLAALIDDVLDLSQIEAGRMALTKERVALGEIIAAATEAIRPLYQTKGLYLHTEAPEGLIVACDRTRIREVLLNLLSNAGRFTERGGVTVQARVAEGEVLVSVADTGPGIAPEDQARLFQPFQQADGSIRRRFGGSGLGLSISKHFVELHDGRMWLASEVGSGATIFFTLPLEPAAAGGGAYERWLSPAWEYRQRTRKWLAPKPVVRPRWVVVERGTLLQRLLRRYGGETELVAVGSLAEAGQELARGPVAALLVHDLDVGGAVERIRAADLLPPGTPALVCALPEQEAAAHAIGANDYLVKPVSGEALLAALDRFGVGRGTILIVDDEQDAIQLFWRILAASGRGYRVLTASNGAEALAILGSDRPDAILLDLTMPGMDGYQLLALRSEAAAWRDVPVIIVSARDPAGHPIVASAIGITRGGGLTVPQLLSYIEPMGLGQGEDHARTP
jgi:signal transduction histidine kinase/CheY-like chemotaxis protein